MQENSPVPSAARNWNFLFHHKWTYKYFAELSAYEHVLTGFRMNFNHGYIHPVFNTLCLKTEYAVLALHFWMTITRYFGSWFPKTLPFIVKAIRNNDLSSEKAQKMHVSCTFLTDTDTSDPYAPSPPKLNSTPHPPIFRYFQNHYHPLPLRAYSLRKCIHFLAHMAADLPKFPHLHPSDLPTHYGPQDCLDYLLWKGGVQNGGSPPWIRTGGLPHHNALSIPGTPLGRCCPGSEFVPTWCPLLWRNRT